MKANYKVDKNNLITRLSAVPFDEAAPFIEVEDIYKIHLNCDKIIDGKLIIDNETYQAQQKAKEEVYAIKCQIDELKKLLADSDYQAIKYAEGELTLEEYTPMKARRQEWRSEINRLEALL